MDVLKRIHRWLRPDGLLLDVHPEPEQPRVEAVLVDRGSVHLGRIDTSALMGNIHAARAALALAVEQRWFERERSLVFDFVSHFQTVDEWLHHRQDRRATSIVDPAIIEQARELLSAHPRGELRVSEHVLATRFRRSTLRRKTGDVVTCAPDAIRRPC